MNRHGWQLLTGEYPPMPGGVADYTRQIALGLLAAGDRVVVWVPGSCACGEHDDGVVVRRLPDHFGRRGLQVLERTMPNAGERLLVQYVPHAFGARSMNLGLVAAVERLAGQMPVDVMFHEVCMPYRLWGPPAHNLLAWAHRRMANRLVRAASRVMVSTLAWVPRLALAGRLGKQVVVCPVPSNLPKAADSHQVEIERDRWLGEGGGPVVGHFGSCVGATAKVLSVAIQRILVARPDARALFIGGGSSRVAEAILPGWPADLRSRAIATGSLGPMSAAAALSLCDVVVLPYPDGVTTRRSSAMAALAAGRAVVTSEGGLSEPLWRDSGAVALAPAGDGALHGERAMDLLTETALRARLSARGLALYDRAFDLRHTIAELRCGVGELEGAG